MTTATTVEVATVFTRLLHQLDLCSRFADQLQQALEAVHQATEATVVFWLNEETGELVVYPAESPYPGDRCREFALQLIARHVDQPRGLVWRAPRPPQKSGDSEPHSAVAVRLRSSQPGWIFALSTRAERVLDKTEVRLMGLAGAMLLKQTQHSRSSVQVKTALFDLVCCLGAVIDAKDRCTAGHSERVSRIAVRIGQQMALSSALLSDLRLAGLLHDIGKVGIRDEVLFKSGKLSAEETQHVQEHVVIGDRIIATITHFGRLRPGVRNHHERYDGKGYPDGLAGEGIPLTSRVLAVADSVDAMMSARRYRGPLSPPQINAVLQKFSGSQWDPQVIRSFMACCQDVYPPIYQKGVGESAEQALDEMVAGMRDGSSTMYRLADFSSP